MNQSTAQVAEQPVNNAAWITTLALIAVEAPIFVFFFTRALLAG